MKLSILCISNLIIYFLIVTCMCSISFFVLSSLKNDFSSSSSTAAKVNYESKNHKTTATIKVFTKEMSTLNATNSKKNNVMSALASVSSDDALAIQNNTKLDDGIPCKTFKKWNYPIPCFKPVRNDMWGKANTLKGGLIYIKTPKTASSTLAGINLRIAHRHIPPNSEFKRCASTYRHHKYYKFQEYNLPKNTTFVWTVIREPTSQYISLFFHLRVGRKHDKPNLINFKKYLYKTFNKTTPPQVRFISHRLPLTSHDIADEISKKNVVQEIIDKYNFIGVTDRLDESLVALRLILGLDAGDILHVSAKISGGYDDGAGGNKCVKIPSSANLTEDIKTYVSSDVEFNEILSIPKLLYKAANKSLDLTIQNTIGQERFNKALMEHKYLMSLVNEKCAPKAIFPCSKDGEHQKSGKDCYYMDAGCGYHCLDELYLNETNNAYNTLEM